MRTWDRCAVLRALACLLGLAMALPAPVAARQRGPSHADHTIARGIHAFYQGKFDDAYFPKSAKTALALAYVTALSFDIPWKTIEPSEGQYDWHLIDGALATAAAAHKKITFGVEVAWWSPDWVKNKAVSFGFSHRILGDLRSPVPWDAVYLAKLKAMVAALGRRYDGNPALEFVVISGPATYWGTETNWAMIPGSIPSADVPGLDFSLPKYTDTWNAMVDTYFDAFPRSNLALALNNQVLGPGLDPQRDQADVESAIRAIRDHALAKQAQTKPGQKMWLELLGLSKGGDGHYTGSYAGLASVTPFEHLVWDVRHAVYVLYQDTVFMRPHRYTPADVARAFAIGISFGADAIEVYTGDLFTLKGEVYQPYRQAIESASREMQGRAGSGSVKSVPAKTR